MDREVKKWLQDIYDSIALVEEYLQKVSRPSDHEKDLRTVDAVERRLAIIGKALWKADKIHPEINISDKKKIISLRHILVHDHDLIDDATI